MQSELLLKVVFWNSCFQHGVVQIIGLAVINIRIERLMKLLNLERKIVAQMVFVIWVISLILTTDVKEWKASDKIKTEQVGLKHILPFSTMWYWPLNFSKELHMWYLNKLNSMQNSWPGWPNKIFSWDHFPKQFVCKTASFILSGPGKNCIICMITQVFEIIRATIKL